MKSTLRDDPPLVNPVRWTREWTRARTRHRDKRAGSAGLRRIKNGFNGPSRENLKIDPPAQPRERRETVHTGLVLRRGSGVPARVWGGRCLMVHIKNIKRIHLQRVNTKLQINVTAVLHYSLLCRQLLPHTHTSEADLLRPLSTWRWRSHNKSRFCWRRPSGLTWLWEGVEVVMTTARPQKTDRAATTKQPVAINKIIIKTHN